MDAGPIVLEVCFHLVLAYSKIIIFIVYGYVLVNVRESIMPR
jgi:hypothetical protein